MGIARGTTPTYRLKFTEETLDLTEANNVYVTFRKGAKILTKTGSDIEVAPMLVAEAEMQGVTQWADIPEGIRWQQRI